MVKRLRRCPLTAKTGVRVPMEVPLDHLCFEKNTGDCFFAYRRKAGIGRSLLFEQNKSGSGCRMNGSAGNGGVFYFSGGMQKRN